MGLVDNQMADLKRGFIDLLIKTGIAKPVPVTDGKCAAKEQISAELLKFRKTLKRRGADASGEFFSIVRKSLAGLFCDGQHSTFEEIAEQVSSRKLSPAAKARLIDFIGECDVRNYSEERASKEDIQRLLETFEALLAEL